MGLFPTHDPKYQAIYAEEAAMVDASELIAEALEASGMSRADLARKLDVARSEITSRLRGDRNITVRNLAATLHALGARLDLCADMPERRLAHEPVDPAAYDYWAIPASAARLDHPHSAAAISSRYELARP